MARKMILPEAGARFGNWEYVGQGVPRSGVAYSLVRCVCGSGVEKEVQKAALFGGHTQSCGCLQVAATKAANTTHGKKSSSIYNIWRGMIKRCTLVSSKDYCRYGGVGIQVCEDWKVFDNFYADMGEPPFDGASIDREDNDGNYEKSNCRWATQHQQSRNKSSNVWATIQGHTLVLRDWLNITGQNEKTVLFRRRAGKTVEEALLEGTRSCKNPAGLIEEFLRGKEIEKLHQVP